MKLSITVLLAACSTLVTAPEPDKGRILPRVSEYANCVEGKATQYGGWTIQYKKVAMPFMKTMFPKKKQYTKVAKSYTIDPEWVDAHRTDADASHFVMGSSWYGYAENSCQYTCNAQKDCVSFSVFRSNESTYDSGELYCYYYDAVITKENAVKQPKDSPFRLYHMYNKLCDQKQKWGMRPVMHQWHDG